jgi:hypothetical protein
MPGASPARWTLSGTVLIACNCDYGCPCNFNARPTQGYCEGQWTWSVASGTVDDVTLDGLAFTICVKWPGAIHEGNGEGIILIDDRADARQREAIATLLSGRFGGPWGILAWTWPKVHGPKAVPYEFSADGVRARLKAGEAMSIETTHIKNPVTGAEVHPSIALPEGIVVKQADLGTTSVFQVTDAITLDHSGKYAAVGPFEYAWP